MLASRLFRCSRTASTIPSCAAERRFGTNGEGSVTGWTEIRGRDLCRWDGDPADRVVVAAEPDEPGLWVEDHVAHRPTAARNRRVTEESLGLGVEPHQAVGVHARLHEPDPVAVVHRHRVRQGRLTARILPLLDLTRLGIEPAGEPATIIRVPDVAIAGASDPPGPARIRKRVFLELQRFRIDGPDLVRAEEIEVGTAL